VMDAGSLILNPIIQEVKRRAFQPCLKQQKSLPQNSASTALPLAPRYSPAMQPRITLIFKTQIYG